MTLLSQTVEIYLDYPMILEIALVGLIIAFIGAGGFVFFYYSMKNDRADIVRKKLAEQNPWGHLCGQDSVEASPSSEGKGSKVSWILALSVIAILILILLAIKYHWFGIYL